MYPDRTVRITLRVLPDGRLDAVWFDLFDSTEVSADTLLATFSVNEPECDLPFTCPTALLELADWVSARVPRIV